MFTRVCRSADEVRELFEAEPEARECCSCPPPTTAPAVPPRAAAVEQSSVFHLQGDLVDPNVLKAVGRVLRPHNGNAYPFEVRRSTRQVR
ncbi:hypothetical protein Lesp02_01450 [Lentzea sp. NBRC 105346]|nr:hypothetical protein Lesp02_01450 [Lentzea sp. NBRC 105346]